MLHSSTPFFYIFCVEISKQEELRIQPPSKRSISCVFDTIHNEIIFYFLSFQLPPYFVLHGNMKRMKKIEIFYTSHYIRYTN